MNRPMLQAYGAESSNDMNRVLIFDILILKMCFEVRYKEVCHE